MKTIVKYISSLFIALLMVSCQGEGPVFSEVPEGYVTVRFMMDVAVQDNVWTKAVDPDGGGVQQMQVFCFDANGIFITTVKAKLNHDTPDQGSTVSMSGTVEVSVPEHAHILQLVGNQNLTFFEEDSYRGMTEIELMSSLEASAGRMIYWARKTVEELKACTTRETAVHLLRNQAKFTIEVSQNVDFVEQGWIVVNTNAFGTVAPYNYDKGEFEIPTFDDPFVTLPDNTARLADYLDVRTNDEEYVFESLNSSANPVDFIVKGSQNNGPSLYYRISIIDEEGLNMPILRNHHYIVTIDGELSYGKETFAEALLTPPTNNVWVAVSPNIKSVSDGAYTLKVNETSVVVGEDDFVMPYRDYELRYSLTSLNGGVLSAPEVSWSEGNEVARTPFDHEFDTSTGEGLIRVYLNEMGNKGKREGTLVIRYGRLTRTIKVMTVKKQSFVPAWITTNIYGGAAGENVTMMFHIPEDFPEEIFPMDVLVSVNDLDVRNASGMVLPIILRGEEGYGEDNGIGYKYVLTVHEPGVQRIYLKTILGHQTGETVSVKIEAEHFEPLTKTATFVNETNNRILLHNLRSYVGSMPADEVIYYYMVPQKKHARVEFTSHLGQVYRTRPAQYDATFTDALGTYYVDYVTPNHKFTQPYNVDEFLLYSENLEHNHDLPEDTYYFDFYKIDASKWSSTAGRVLGFFRNENGTPGQGATFHLRTMIPKADEVVRVATNPYGSPSITTGDPGELASTGYSVSECTGTGLYKSAVFEIATFHPFHFSAQVKVGGKTYGDITKGTRENPVTDVSLGYQPGQPVMVEFDVTSFKSDLSSVADAEQLSVDPFGMPFEIYIDAPMLELDKAALNPSWLVPDADGMVKLEEDKSIPGRFIYRVDVDREKERTFGVADALSKDDSVLDLFRLPVTVDQSGERKVIPFRTKQIVSAGDIRISSQEDIVVYYPKRFRVQNSSMAGKLMYMKDGVAVPVPAGSFVPFEVAPSYNRIGTISIADGGLFELRLRSEYQYSWAVDVVKFQFTEGGVIYEKSYDSLAELNNALTTGDGTVVLEPRSAE
jgi:hypothetical protein